MTLKEKAEKALDYFTEGNDYNFFLKHDFPEWVTTLLGVCEDNHILSDWGNGWLYNTVRHLLYMIINYSSIDSVEDETESDMLLFQLTGWSCNFPEYVDSAMNESGCKDFVCLLKYAQLQHKIHLLGLIVDYLSNLKLDEESKK